MKNLLIAFSAVVLLAGCQTTTNPTPTTQSAQNPLLAVSSTRAMEVFQVLCGGTLPNFSGLAKKASVYGTWRPLDQGVILNNQLDMSYKLFNENGQKTCSFVFGTTDTKSQVKRAFGQLGLQLSFSNPKPKDPIIVGYAKGSEALQKPVIAALYDKTATKELGRTYYNMHMYLFRQ